MTAGAVVSGAVIRFGYLAIYRSTSLLGIGGDGFAYHFDALLFADGQPYRTVVDGAPSAFHPPGWPTLLGLVSKLGVRSLWGHQVVSVLLGLTLVVIAALLARRVFGDGTGAVAGFVAALYPGFWVLEAQILSETLGLVVLGVALILVYRLRDRLSWARLLLLAVTTGVLVLVRSEPALAVLVTLAVVLVKASTDPVGRRVLFGVVTLGIVMVMVAPWSIYSSRRFEEPVLISTNTGPTLLNGACALNGPLLGLDDDACYKRVAGENGPADRSVKDKLSREAAITRLSQGKRRLPLVAAARVGRTLGIYRPAQTVSIVAEWNATPTWPVWLWVGSFWVLLPLGILGGVVARRRRIWILPLVMPILVTLGVVVVFTGQPRYHAMADLSFVVLGAYGLVAIGRRLTSGRRSARRQAHVSATSDVG